MGGVEGGFGGCSVLVLLFDGLRPDETRSDNNGGSSAERGLHALRDRRQPPLAARTLNAGANRKCQPLTCKLPRRQIDTPDVV
jgi:hypothetical protein